MDLQNSADFKQNCYARGTIVSARNGQFALANGGTILLDEIGEMLKYMKPQFLEEIAESCKADES